MCNQGDAVLSTWILNFQPMKRRYVTRDVRPCLSGFITHTVHGGTDLGAHASKASPAPRDPGKEDDINTDIDDFFVLALLPE